MTAPCLLIVAGEASGDQHGSGLVRELAAVMPETELFGLGGEGMKGLGVRSRFDSRDIAVMGFTEVAKVLPRGMRIFRSLLAEVQTLRPRAAVLIDAPGFNLRLAKRLKRLGVPVIYYVSPQVWAWRRGRVRGIARRVDLMLVLFPFEAEFYRDAQVPVIHVGHPLVDEVPELPQIWDRQPPDELPDELHLALLPGSREPEVRALLPAMLDAASILATRSATRVSLIQAPTVSRRLLDELVVRTAIPIPVEIVRRDRFAVIADSHVALCASGTATLEVGLLGTPMLVVYRLGRFTELLARRLVKVAHFSLVNLVLGGDVVPELVQGQVTGESLARRVCGLLEDRAAIERMRQGLSALRRALGDRGASRRAAAAVAEFLRLRRGAADGGAA